jgi:hypothetical protein
VADNVRRWCATRCHPARRRRPAAGLGARAEPRTRSPARARGPRRGAHGRRWSCRRPPGARCGRPPPRPRRARSRILRAGRHRASPRATLALLGETGGALLTEADRVARKLTPAQVETSRVLPLAFANRCHALAKQAAEGKPITRGRDRLAAPPPRGPHAPRRASRCSRRWGECRATSTQPFTRPGPHRWSRCATISAAARSPTWRSLQLRRALGQQRRLPR